MKEHPFKSHCRIPMVFLRVDEEIQSS